MSMIEFKGKNYFDFQAEGNAAQWILPFAERLCKGIGYDIGCSKIEWSLPGSIPIDLEFDDPWHATNLPDNPVDYIFSSHCLEHISDWVEAIIYWKLHIKPGGVLFLYLPHYDQEYWRPWWNRKHVNVMKAEEIEACLSDLGFKNIVTTGRDLNHSFCVYAERGNY